MAMAEGAQQQHPSSRKTVATNSNANYLKNGVTTVPVTKDVGYFCHTIRRVEAIDSKSSQQKVVDTEGEVVVVPNEISSSHTIIGETEAIDTHSNQQNVIDTTKLVEEANDTTNSSQHKVVETEIEVVPIIDFHSNQHQDNNIDTEIRVVPNQVGSSQEQVVNNSATSIKSEILKSVLYGGLTELIASLGIVTSASTTGATTGKIVGLSLANLITGVFVMIYKISEHWIKDEESGGNEGKEQEEEDKYEELFGDRQNHRLHLSVAIVSFIIFGLVPPLIYGFTFRKPEEKILKIPTVTIVSGLFIGLLGAAKAYIEKPENCLEYVYIIGTCIVDAIGTSTLTTFGGELIENYVEQAGWFDFGENNKVTTILFLPGMDNFQNHTWRSLFKLKSNLPSPL